VIMNGAAMHVIATEDDMVRLESLLLAKLFM
jgi:hypothetical protein